MIGGLLARPWSREAAWTFVSTRWDTLTQLLGTFQGIPGIVRSLGGSEALAWSLQSGLTVEQMLAMPYYHPVIEEGLRTGLRDLAAKMRAVRETREAA